MYKSNDNSNETINSLEDLENLINQDIENLIKDYEKENEQDNSDNNN